ncbi:MAG: GAF domain-containing sensor histidine kinase [Cyanobacteriota bacterium]
MEAISVGEWVSNMTNDNHRLFCRLDGLSVAARENKRLAALKNIGLLEAGIPPVFDEATQMAARFLEVPICVLGLMVQDQFCLKSAVGLSSVGLMNQLAASRKIPRSESLSRYVVDSEHYLLVEDAAVDAVLSQTIVVQHYGIRAYLGVPLIATTGDCLGALAVMDLAPRQFSAKDVDFLSMTARWCLSEFERNHVLRQAGYSDLVPSLNYRERLLFQAPSSSRWEDNAEGDDSTVSKGDGGKTNSIKLQLLSHLSQELRTPLTSVMGMASVLGREIYGPLTTKQKEYLEIIHNSGQHLLALVEEIVNLGVFDQTASTLNLAPVDIEMVCQQAINNLLQVAQQRQQTIHLSVEPGNRIWLLDKEKLRQALYYLVLNIIESSESGSQVRVHVSRKREFGWNGPTLNIAVWVSHPWLGDGLSGMELYSSSMIPPGLSSTLGNGSSSHSVETVVGWQSLPEQQILDSVSLGTVLTSQDENYQLMPASSREKIGLLLSCHLVELHGGQITVQGSIESGYRYVLKLPQVPTTED